MGDTRDPALGSWVVFEGTRNVSGLDSATPWGGNINREMGWPLTLRYFCIKDGLFYGVDVEIAEDLTVTVNPHRPIRTGSTSTELEEAIEHPEDKIVVERARELLAEAKEQLAAKDA